jgi:hypothetical protein
MAIPATQPVRFGVGQGRFFISRSGDATVDCAGNFLRL